MTTRRSVTYLLETATKQSPSWTNKEIAMFHYLNDNGVFKAFNKMCDTIRDYVDAGVIPSGWHYAYGSFNNYYTDRLEEMYRRKRLNTLELEVIIEGIERDTINGYTRLGQFISEEQS